MTFAKTGSISWPARRAARIGELSEGDWHSSVDAFKFLKKRTRKTNPFHRNESVVEFEKKKSIREMFLLQIVDRLQWTQKETLNNSISLYDYLKVQ